MMQKHRIPTWDEYVERQSGPLPAYESPLLKVYPEIVRPGDVTVFYGTHRFYLNAIGRHLVEHVVWREPKINAELVYVFSMLQDSRKYLTDMVVSMARINSWRAHHNYLTSDEAMVAPAQYEEARKQLLESGIEVFDAVSMDLDDVEEVIGGRWFGRFEEIGMVLIEGLLECFSRKFGNGEFGWGVVGSHLSRIARIFEVPVVVLAEAPFEHLKKPYELFKGMDIFRNYLNQAFTVKYGNRTSDEKGLVRPMIFEHVSGKRGALPFALEFDPETNRLLETPTFEPDSLMYPF